MNPIKNTIKKFLQSDDFGTQVMQGSPGPTVYFANLDIHS